MAATVAGILLTGNHAGRPSSGVSAGTLYSCTTHSLIYQTSDTGSTWGTWATLTGTGLADPMTTRGDVIVRNASNATDRLAIGSSGTFLSSDGTDVSWQTPSSGFATTAHAEQSADVTLTADTLADATGASVSLAAGTWDIIAVCTFKSGGSAGYCLGFLRTGAGTAVASGRGWVNASNYFTVTMLARVSPGSTTTYKISGQSATTNDKIVKFPDGSTIGTAITATRVA